jgi:hypothetical protein
MNPQVASEQAWPNWAKFLLIATAILAILVALPWIFMWTTMAASCVPMMNGMREMMGPGMMR